MVLSRASGLQFVVSTGVEKTDPELRKIIRSHVMQGKNKGKTRGHRKLQANRLDNNHTAPVAKEANLDFIQIPPKIGSELSTINFSDPTIKSAHVEIVIKFSSIAKKVLFALEPCIFFEHRASAWVAPLTIDAAYLHVTIFTSQYYFDTIANLPHVAGLSQRCLPHYLAAIKLLRERLQQADDPLRVSDSTIAAVMGITGHALLTGDLKSAKHHIAGLFKIISLRGGLAGLNGATKLVIEVLRCDLGIALYSGSKPIMLEMSPQWNSIPPYPELTGFLDLAKSAAVGTSITPAMPVDGIDVELAKAYIAIWEFSFIVNYAVDSRQRITTDIFLETMSATMFRLLAMDFSPSSRDEAVRLGLIAFCSAVFLQWRQCGLSYHYFSNELRKCLVNSGALNNSPRLLLWLLVIGSASVFESSDDGWLKPLLIKNIDSCKIDSWGQMRELLKSFVWVDLVYEKPCKFLYESVSTRPELLM